MSFVTLFMSKQNSAESYVNKIGGRYRRRYQTDHEGPVGYRPNSCRCSSYNRLLTAVFGGVEDVDLGEIARQLAVVEPVADHETIRYPETDVIQVDVGFRRLFLV